MSYADHVTRWLNEQTCDGAVKRRRKVSRRQRVAANDRERRRMRQLNAAFDRLRQQIPAPVHASAAAAGSTDRSHHRPLSRIQTLRLAIDYIAFMMNTLHRSEKLGVGGQYAEQDYHNMTAADMSNYTEDETKPLLQQFEFERYAQQAVSDIITMTPASDTCITYAQLQPL